MPFKEWMQFKGLLSAFFFFEKKKCQNSHPVNLLLKNIYIQFIT
jgi:hypothetical protein